MIIPTFNEELRLLDRYRYLAGIDEVGRGPLAGPVVAAAVILDPEKIDRQKKWWNQVRDSKIVPVKKRSYLSKFIKENCRAWAIGVASHREIDEWNIHYAALLAMRRAVESLNVFPEMLLIDGKFIIPRMPISQKNIIDGDARVLSIAAASIIAKVFRDKWMENYSRVFTGYGFEKHKGYDTDLHRCQLLRHGPCDLHRMSFETVKSAVTSRFQKMLE